MKFTPDKAWIFVYLLFVTRILPDVPCMNKEVFSMDSRLSFYPLFIEYRPKSSQTKLSFMEHLIYYSASKVVPRRAHTEFITNNPNKKGGVI